MRYNITDALMSAYQGWIRGQHFQGQGQWSSRTWMPRPQM